MVEFFSPYAAAQRMFGFQSLGLSAHRTNACGDRDKSSVAPCSKVSFLYTCSAFVVLSFDMIVRSTDAYGDGVDLQKS